MDRGFFESIVIQAKRYTKEIACHVLGDPLTHPYLQEYLEILHRHGMRAMLTTSGYFLNKQSYDTLFHPCVKQINISLNSYNKNESSISFIQYLQPILALCHEKLRRNAPLFINLRVWNLDEGKSEEDFNRGLFAHLSRAFDTPLSLERIYSERPKSIRLASKVLVHFDSYFEWPSLDNRVYGDGSCQGLSSHIAILASGKVVPCCLDCDGVIPLGDLHRERLEDILEGSRASAMIAGFKAGKAVEALCQKCGYKERFKT